MACLDIIINGQVKQRFELNGAETLIGRSPAAQIQLAGPYVSGRHALVARAGKSFQIEDLGSVNGTLVNGQEIHSVVSLQPNDRIEIGEYRLIFRDQMEKTANDSEPLPDDDSLEITQSKAPAQPVPRGSDNHEAGFCPDEAYRALKNKAHRLTIERMNLKKLTSREANDQDLREMAEERLDAIIRELAAEIPAALDKARFKREVLNDILGLGPLEDLLEDESVTEIMANGWNKIYYESEGRLRLSDRRFLDDDHLMAVIQRIVAPVGRAINESSPLVDARLKDGSRVNAIIPPLSLKGPCVTIRKFAKRRLSAEDLIRFGSLDRNMVEFLELAVRERCNVVISGGTGSGKTTLLNILSGFIPASERIITVEDAAELQLQQEHVVSLESRPANMEGAGAITIRDLVRNCLRMRPDRIVVGECRGGEALDMLQAMNTGHDGSLTTAHANSPRDVISRLETMVLMSGMDLPVRAIREQIASAVDLIVQQSRMPDGTRKITHITEIDGIQNDTILTGDIFTFKQEGYDESGRVLGKFQAHGVIPRFVEKLREKGVAVNLEIFTNRQGEN